MIIKAVSSFFALKQYQLLSSMVPINFFASASGFVVHHSLSITKSKHHKPQYPAVPECVRVCTRSVVSDSLQSCGP